MAAFVGRAVRWGARGRAAEHLPRLARPAASAATRRARTAWFEAAMAARPQAVSLHALPRREILCGATPAWGRPLSQGAAPAESSSEFPYPISLAKPGDNPRGMPFPSLLVAVSRIPRCSCASPSLPSSLPGPPGPAPPAGTSLSAAASVAPSLPTLRPPCLPP